MAMEDILLQGKYRPLRNILSYDIFDRGFNGWMVLLPNFTEGPDFDVPPTKVNKDQWPPVMLSTATYRFPGTHGSMSGTYSLKLSTRPVANPYSMPPAPGSMGHAIKRLSFFDPSAQYLQLECWFAYTAEQDTVDGDGPQPGLHENSIRAFGIGSDTQDDGNRFFWGIRYLNSVDASQCVSGNTSVPRLTQTRIGHSDRMAIGANGVSIVGGLASVVRMAITPDKKMCRAARRI
jgi:hypothetical protein